MTVQRRGALDGPGVAELIDLMMEPTPASHVRLMLKIHRDRGIGFERAWAQAMRSLPREPAEIAWWRAQFHKDKPRWRAAYDGPAEQREAA